MHSSICGNKGVCIPNFQEESVMTAIQENLAVSEEPILQFALWRDFK